MIIGAFQVRYLDLNGYATDIGRSPFVTDIVAKRFLVPERGIIFEERVRMENIDSRIPSFGFCYCLLQRVDGSLADFCNTIDPKRTTELLTIREAFAKRSRREANLNK